MLVKSIKVSSFFVTYRFQLIDETRKKYSQLFVYDPVFRLRVWICGFSVGVDTTHMNHETDSCLRTATMRQALYYTISHHERKLCNFLEGKFCFMPIISKIRFTKYVRILTLYLS